MREMREHHLNGSVYKSFLEIVNNDVLFDEVYEEGRMWNIWNSFYFSFTAITTIGFGHMYPSTSSGQFFCIIYSIFGVPLNGIVFGGLEMIYSRWMVYRIDQNSYKDKKKLFIYCILYLLPGMFVFMMLPGIVFIFTEGWSFLEGFYFAFITITTIGFGDYVAGYSADLGRFTYFYRVCIYIWIVFGLGYFLMMVNFFQRFFRSDEVRKFDRKIKSTISLHATQRSYPVKSIETPHYNNQPNLPTIDGEWKKGTSKVEDGSLHKLHVKKNAWSWKEITPATKKSEMSPNADTLSKNPSDKDCIDAHINKAFEKEETPGKVQSLVLASMAQTDSSETNQTTYYCLNSSNSAYLPELIRNIQRDLKQNTNARIVIKNKLTRSHSCSSRVNGHRR